MRERWWIGVAAGVVLGLGTVVAVDAATDEANAQTATFRVTPEQLRINQRISQAAVRRSNESLNLLDPVRKSGQQDDAPGWGTTAIANNAVTAEKLAPSVREGQPRWAVVTSGTGALARARGATASAKLAGVGEYTVTFDRDVTACSYQVSVAAGDTTAPPTGEVTARATAGQAQQVTVVTADSAGAPVNTIPFHIAVFC